jgi:uncharacterized damage-inducible protein DinB
MQRLLSCLTILLAASTASQVAQAQAHAGTPPTAPPNPQSAAVAPTASPTVELQKSYAAVKANILKSADKMPPDNYSFKPEPDIRTYARVLNHVSETQLHICGAINGTAPTELAKVPSETADKAEVVEALKASFEECDKAYASLTDHNLTDPFSGGPVKRSRIGFLWGNVAHDQEQYATLALYLRLKDIAPPSSEK